jgi:glycolate oxidase
MLNPVVIKDLRKIVGPFNVLTEPEELTVYSYDATRLTGAPDAVVRPATSEEVSRVLLLANRERFPVAPRGAGTGMSGGSVPLSGGVVLSFERMDRILEIDEANRIAVVEPGVITGDLQREVESRGLFYPPDPASSNFCTIGGNVAECAGGLRAVKYGVTKDYVLGLEVVLPTGGIIKTGARTSKSVAGYDLTRLIIGSEGTLGVITKVIVRLLPLPERVETLAALFADRKAALSVLPAITEKRVLPRTLEFIDGAALRVAEGYLGTVPPSGAAAMLLIETDGTAGTAAREIETIESVCRKAGAAEIRRALDRAGQEKLWKLRKSISPALYALKPVKINEDIVVPVDKLAVMLAAIDDIAARRGLQIVNFGHAGDGNIHTNIMIEEHERPIAELAVREILETVVRLEGSISGEHGIGICKSAYLPLEVGADALVLMKRIKEVMDPKNILNPGKIFLNVECGVRNAE